MVSGQYRDSTILALSILQAAVLCHCCFQGNDGLRKNLLLGESKRSRIWGERVEGLNRDNYGCQKHSTVTHLLAY